jgi:lysophospholipase L1-like esterase
MISTLASPLVSPLVRFLVGGNDRFLPWLAFIGDSNTNGVSGIIIGTGAAPRFMVKSFAGFAASRLFHAFLPVPNPYPILGPGYNDVDFGVDGATSDQLRNSSVNAVSTGNNKWPGVDISTVGAALATNPFAVCILAGTNNLLASTAAEIIASLDELLATVAASTKYVYIGELPPRTDTTADPGGAWTAKIATVNAALPALAASYGATVIAWHDALCTDGTANLDYFPDEDPGAGTIRLHPNMAGHAVMGQILATTLAGRFSTPYPLPGKNALAWLTPNAFMDIGEDGLATGFANYGGGAAATPSLFTDGDGVPWQKFARAGAGIAWAAAPAIPEATRAAYIGSGMPIRCACQYRIVSGSCTSMSLNGTLTTAGFAQLAACGQNYDIADASQGTVVAHEGLFLSQPIRVPATATLSNLQILFRFSGAAELLVRRFGWFVSRQ